MTLLPQNFARYYWTVIMMDSLTPLAIPIGQRKKALTYYFPATKVIITPIKIFENKIIILLSFMVIQVIQKYFLTKFGGIDDTKGVNFEILTLPPVFQPQKHAHYRSEAKINTLLRYMAIYVFLDHFGKILGSVTSQKASRF